MEAEKKYPYLGKCTINEKCYTVLFSSPDYGTVVQSDFNNSQNIHVGFIGSFDESMFIPLESDICVRISNDF